MSSRPADGPVTYLRGRPRPQLSQGFWIGSAAAGGAGQDRQHDVEVDVERDRAGQGVQAEGLDGSGEALLDVHPPPLTRFGRLRAHDSEACAAAFTHVRDVPDQVQRESSQRATTPACPE